MAEVETLQCRGQDTEALYPTEWILYLLMSCRRRDPTYWQSSPGIFPISTPEELTHRGRDKLGAISQTMFSSAWKLSNFKWIFIETCSSGSNWKYGSIGSDNGLAPYRRQAIIRTNGGIFYWRIYASLGLSELTLRINILSTSSVSVGVGPLSPTVISDEWWSPSVLSAYI